MKKTKTSKKFLWNLFVLFIIITALIQCDFIGSSYDEYPFEMLSFPFLNPTNIERMAAFGIPNWSGSEPHNGIDLIIYESIYGARIISPSNGTVESINVSENPYSHPANQMLLSIRIYINSEWTVNLVIEPGTTDEAIKTAQRNAVLIEEGDTIVRGQSITDLLVGEHGYPHLHYMVLNNNDPVCAYTFSTGSARNTFQEIAETRSDNHLPDGNICFGESD